LHYFVPRIFEPGGHRRPCHLYSDIHYGRPARVRAMRPGVKGGQIRSCLTEIAPSFQEHVDLLTKGAQSAAWSS
jgi:hypothetical protein